MDAAEILYQLTHAEALPKVALQAASEQRAEMVLACLGEIDSYLALASADRVKPTPLFFIFHLLGDWREKSAYRPLARLLRCPSHEVEAAIGDAITATAHRVMAAVFDGDPGPLCEIILDPNADQCIRSRMCETLAMIVLQGELDSETAARFFRDAFMELRPQAKSFVWQGWQSAIAMLGLVELKILVKRAFDRRFIDPQWLGYEDFFRDLERGATQPRVPRQHIAENSPYSATRSRNYPAGMALARNMRIAESKFATTPRPMYSLISPIGIPSKELAEMIGARVAAAKNSKNAASLSTLRRRA